MRQYSYLGIAVALFIFALAFERMNKESIDPSRYVTKLEHYLKGQSDIIDDYISDTTFLKKVIQRDFKEKDWDNLEQISRAKYSFYVYQEDSLVFWSNNKVLPYDSDTKYTTSRKTKFVRLKHGQYVLIKESFQFQELSNKRYTVIALVPIYYTFPVENEYLQNRFATKTPIPQAVQISFKATEYPVTNLDGKPLFYLTALEEFTDYSVQIGLLLIYLLGFIFLCIFLNKTAINFIKRYSSYVGVTFLALFLIVIRALSVHYDFLGRFDEISLFNSLGYIPSIGARSIGGMLINGLLTLWIIVFMYRELDLTNLGELKPQWKVPFLGAVYASIFAAIFMIGRLTKGLIIESDVSFDFNNVFSLNIYSFLGIVAISIAMVCLFLFTHKIFTNSTPQLQISNATKYKLITGVIFLFAVLNYETLLTYRTISLLIFAGIYIFLFEFFTTRNTASFTWLVTWLFVFASFSSGLLLNYSNERGTMEQMEYAQKLAIERDLNVEKRFEDLSNKIKENPFIKLIDNPFIPRQGIIDQIEKFYLEDPFIFNTYDYEAFLYNTDKIGRKGEVREYAAFEPYLTVADTTSSPNLKFWSDNKGTFFYLAELLIQEDGKDKGIIIMELTPKKIDKSKVYPELLMDESLQKQKKYSKYDYAIYKDGRKLMEKGNHNVTLDFEAPETQGDFNLSRRDDQRYLIYKAHNDKIVIIGKKNDEVLKPMSLFSYMFCFLSLIILLLSILNYFVKGIPNASALNFRVASSLRNRIQTSVIAVIILIFIVIGLVTVIYFRIDSDSYHSARLGRKSKGIIASAKYEIGQHPAEDLFFPDINALSSIHRMDINLYGLDGLLIRSSQPEIFEKGLISTRMSTIPYHIINKKSFSNYPYSESIGDLDYQAAYLALNNAKGDLIGFLGIPYYSERSDLRNDVADFMGALLNVYVFLLLIAGIAAILIANSITKPLAVLGNKLKQVTLGKKNEPLEWDSSDEIGALIEEYNKMIAELDRSAGLLAKSEREGAWREMAKQVAHEIKNPLTPMKLSIQYLQRAYETRPEAIGGMLKRVSTTLVEQIDSLSRIATEFSNFAKMPNTQNEQFILNDLVKSVYVLFREGEQEDKEIDVSLQINAEDLEIFADKEQFGRVLNNVIKNAIQAIPDERAGEVNINLEQDNKYALIKVTDNGCGIPADKMDSIFVPNFTTKNSGTGLGLAISKKIVENAGGRIFFETKENIGTTFFIEVPLFDENNMPPENENSVNNDDE